MSRPAPTPPESPTLWRVSRVRTLDLSAPRVAAIINVTPDSFSDGGEALDPRAALEAARRALSDGAAMLDIGGESTRPGSARVSAAEQIARVTPVIRAVRAEWGDGAGVGGAPPISVDTTLAEVADAALDAGADAINDVSAGGEDPSMFALAARRGAGLVLMHRLRPPGEDRFSDQYQPAEAPRYADVVAEVRAWLAARLAAALGAGLPAEAIVLDPGLGFGKTVDQNLALIRGSGALLSLGRPLMSGLSRKSFTARAAGMDPGGPPRARIAGTLALSIAHVRAGARLLRVHDVPAHRAALSVWQV